MLLSNSSEFYESLSQTQTKKTAPVLTRPPIPSRQRSLTTILSALFRRPRSDSASSKGSSTPEDLDEIAAVMATGNRLTSETYSSITFHDTKAGPRGRVHQNREPSSSHVEHDDDDDHHHFHQQDSSYGISDERDWGSYARSPIISSQAFLPSSPLEAPKYAPPLNPFGRTLPDVRNSKPAMPATLKDTMTAGRSQWVAFSS